MKRLWNLLIMLLISSAVQSQYKVRFVLKENTAIHHDSIYITGSFNEWDSLANQNYLMKPSGVNEKSITLNLKPGIIQYKFTRGNWKSVEKTSNGDEVANREIAIHKDTILSDKVDSWRDFLLLDKKYELARQKSDTLSIGILTDISNTYTFQAEYYNADSALCYARKAIQLQQKVLDSHEYKLLSQNRYSRRLIELRENMAMLLHSFGNFQKALEVRMENLKLAEKENDKIIRIIAIRNMNSDYVTMKDFRNGLKYGKLTDSILSSMDKKNPSVLFEQWNAKYSIAISYFKMQQPDSALFYAKQMEAIDLKAIWSGATVNVNQLLGNIYSKAGNDVLAYHYYRLVIANASKFGAEHLIAAAQAGMAKVLLNNGKLDSSLIYAKQALTYFQNKKLDVWQAWGEIGNSYLAEISPLVAEIYKKKNQLDSAYKYLNLSVILKDSLYNGDKIRQFQTLTFNEASRRQQLEQQHREEEQLYKTKIKMFGLIAGLIAILIFALILYRNNKQKQKANSLLQKQKKEIETTLGELKTTQAQLIQSEKMASLGELTAGIAHEIQNPLNFVNNFSEVNSELIEEMKTELKAGNAEEAIALANDIADNEQKINHHGKRADAIVKGMLQHSRSSSGVKEPTNINTLTDEYLRLAYHGLRAKDKSFNATLKTDFDESIGKIDIIPQDIGRVILNLITNAFYAVDEKKKLLAKDLTGPEAYQPTVSVGTKRLGENILISVKDNGNGIPSKVLDKIFQPFFTTKPTGQGTGLGLSLSYDIVKAHGGELSVETKEGEGTEMILTIPI